MIPVEKPRAIVVAVALTILLVGLAPRASASVRAEMLVTTEWLAEHLADPNVVVLHVARGHSQYDAGHIPGARMLLLDEMTTTREGVPNELPSVAALEKLFTRLGVGEHARVVLYGGSWGLFAARAYFTLDYLGRGDRTALLDGGLEKWKAEKRPTSTEPVESKPAPFTARVHPKALVERDAMREVSKSKSLSIVDARPPEDYAIAGHIPGASNVFWLRNVVGKENPVMPPEAELRSLYESAGARRGRGVVTYCRTGAQASHAYFTLKYLGYDVSLYDGSFAEWSNLPDAPIEK